MATSTNWQSVLEWLKNPSSLISLSAAVLSLITFFLVYVDKGEIEVLLPQNLGIGISADTGNMDILVSATYSNTGAPRTRRHILHITGIVQSLDKAAPIDGEYKWTYEQRFIGKDEYLKKYPDKKDEGHRDYLDYVSRAIPFTLKGGESTAKTIELERPQKTTSLLPSKLRINLVVHTDSGTYKSSSTYVCPSTPLSVGAATYCEREGPTK